LPERISREKHQPALMGICTGDFIGILT